MTPPDRAGLGSGRRYTPVCSAAHPSRGTDVPFRELIGKTLGFGLVAASLIVGGLLVFYGPHPYNDYLNGVLGLTLIALGLLAGGLGILVIGAVFVEARRQRRAHEVHIAPRSGPPSLPPAWGMGDVGRPGHGVVEVGDRGSSGGGTTRVMSVAVSNIDGPLLVLGLVAWTVVALIFLAPR